MEYALIYMNVYLELVLTIVKMVEVTEIKLSIILRLRTFAIDPQGPSSTS